MTIAYMDMGSLLPTRHTFVDFKIIKYLSSRGRRRLWEKRWTVLGLHCLALSVYAFGASSGIHSWLVLVSLQFPIQQTTGPPYNHPPLNQHLGRPIILILYGRGISCGYDKLRWILNAIRCVHLTRRLQVPRAFRYVIMLYRVRPRVKSRAE